MAAPHRLVLASTSPRRRDLLASAGLEFDLFRPEVDETPLVGEEPQACARRVAKEKATIASDARPDAVVLAADTIVVVERTILGKPKDGADAATMLLRLSGRSHQVITAVAVLGPRGSFQAEVRTEVRFRKLSAAMIEWYVDTGEPLDKAGAYAIQGKGGLLVESISGSYSNVVGLPLVESLDLLERAGIATPWSSRERA